MTLSTDIKYSDEMQYRTSANVQSSNLRLPAKFPSLNKGNRGDKAKRLAQYDLFALHDVSFEMLIGDAAMSPTIPSGATLILDKERTPVHNDIVVASVYGELLCRRIFISKRRVWLYGDDKEFMFINYEQTPDMFIYGVVTSHFVEHDKFKFA